MAAHSAPDPTDGPAGQPSPERLSAGHSAALSASLRDYQCADVLLGGLYRALHTMVERTWAEWFYDDGCLPTYTLGFDETNNEEFGKGYFVNVNGALLPNYISLNVWRHSNAEEVVETLCHEVTHLWQMKAGLPVGHADHFRVRMAEMGIAANSHGIHVAYTTGRWQAWLVENEDLQLANYLLPGSR